MKGLLGYCRPPGPRAQGIRWVRGTCSWRRRGLLRRLVRRGVGAGPLAFCSLGVRRRRRAVRAGASGRPFARCALRAFFHALRVAPACLRARLASRLASLTLLRARLSSSLAIRTRCRATSASSRARSRGSAGSAAEGALGAEASRLPLAPDGIAPADRFFLAGFPMQKAWWQRASSLTQRSRAYHRDFIHRFCE